MYSVPLAPVLRGPENPREFAVTNAWVTPQGAAIVAVSNGYCYSYDQVCVKYTTIAIFFLIFLVFREFCF
jgi:hypothetical protein